MTEGRRKVSRLGRAWALERTCLGFQPPRGNIRKWRGPEVLGGKHWQRAGVRAGAGKEGNDGVGHMGDAESQPGV